METIITKLDELTEQRIQQENEIEKISYMALPGVESIRNERRKKFREKYWDCRYNQFPASSEEIEKYKKGYDSIVVVVFSFFGAKENTKTRKREICFPRQISQYFAYHLSRLSLQQIADKFEQNHATTLNCVKKVSFLIETGDKTWNNNRIMGADCIKKLFDKFDKNVSFPAVYTELENKVIDKLIIDYKF